MANFVLIENNEIIEYHDLLPSAWKHISGLNLAVGDEQFLNSLGWYTVNKTYPHIDYGLQYIDGYEYTFENNIVTENPIIKNAVIYDPPPEKTPEELFTVALNDLRVERDRRLAESDWTQLADVQALRSQQWKDNYGTYRQQLRDLPNQCISGLINIYNFEWPTLPQDVIVNDSSVTEPPVENQEP